MNTPALRCVQVVWCGLMALLVLVPDRAGAQVVNPSFEQDGQFSLVGWRVTDASCQGAYAEAPPGGGAWALMLHRPNLQGGCFGVAYQVMPGARSGVWRATAWVRVPGGSTGAARMYWTTFDPADTSGVLPYTPKPIGAIATASVAEWTALTLVDTLSIAAGDSLGLVLDGSLTSGPTRDTDMAYFDLITVEHRSDPVASGDEEAPDVPAFSRAYTYPNPFRAVTTVSFTLKQPGFVTLDIYDMLGRKVSALLAGTLAGGSHTAVWEAGTLPDGLYVGHLRAGAHVRTIKLVRLR